MMKLRVSKESYAMIVGAASGLFDDRGVKFLSDGVEIKVKPATLARIQRVDPDPDVAIAMLTGSSASLH